MNRQIKKGIITLLSGAAAVPFTACNLVSNDVKTIPEDTTPPIVQIFETSSYVVQPGEAVQIDVAATDETGMAYIGMNIDGKNHNYNSFGEEKKELSHSWIKTFFQPGNYEIKLTAVDKAGNETIETKSIHVNNLAGIIENNSIDTGKEENNNDYTYTRDTTGLTETIEDTTYSVDNTIIENPNETVNNSETVEDTSKTVEEITGPLPPQITLFELDKDTIRQGEYVTSNIFATDDKGINYVQILSEKGSQVYRGEGKKNMSVNWTKHFTDTGDFNISLKVADVEGKRAFAEKTLTVLPYDSVVTQ